MKFSAQEEYGLRCLVAVAQQGPEGSLTIPDLSRREALSQPHVAKLMSILRKAGFVKSTRGQVGGYQLNLPPDKIVVGNVLEELGGRLYGEEFCARHSGLNSECVHKDCTCLVGGLWTDIQAAVDKIVYGITLQDILDGKLKSGDQKLVSITQRPEPNGR